MISLEEAYKRACLYVTDLDVIGGYETSDEWIFGVGLLGKKDVSVGYPLLCFAKKDGAFRQVPTIPSEEFFHCLELRS